jgi:chromate reductase, NAD(P)H dehydrogenase (quinone)
MKEKTMKLSVLLGSLRKESFHRKLLSAYCELARGEFEFSEIPTQDFPHYNSDLEENMPQIIHTHGNTIKSSDGILIISPEYNYSLPGHLKNAIDWLSRLEQKPFDGKKTAIIGGSPGNVATARMQYEMRKIGVFLNLHFLNKPEVMINKLFDKFDGDGRLIDDDTLTFLYSHIKAFKTFMQN